MIQLIVSDMDGTLLNDVSSISSENVKAIAHAQEKGALFAIATGRHYKEARHALGNHPIKCPIMAVNGAAIYDEDGQLVHLAPLDNTDVLSVLENMKDFPDLLVDLITVDGVFSANKERREARLRKFIIAHFDNVEEIENLDALVEEQMATFPATFVPSFEDFLKTNTDNPVLKILITCGDNPDRLSDFKAQIVDYPNLSVTSSNVKNLEINALTATKGIALTRYAESKGIPLDKVMALGDNLNDFSMVSIVGYGIAMGNAVEPLKKVAKYVTAHVKEDGVAQAIYHYLP